MGVSEVKDLLLLLSKPKSARKMCASSIRVLCEWAGKHDTPARTGGSRGLQASEKSAATPRPSGPDPIPIRTKRCAPSIRVFCEWPGKHNTPARTGGSRGLQASEKPAQRQGLQARSPIQSARKMGAPSIRVLCEWVGKHDTPARTGGSRGLQASEKLAATPRPSGPDSTTPICFVTGHDFSHAEPYSSQEVSS
jgi:hypothetical protein